MHIIEMYLLKIGLSHGSPSNIIILSSAEAEKP